MTKSRHWLLALALATPAFAQDEAPAEAADAVPVEEPAAEESPAADESQAAEESPPADASAEAPLEEIPVEEVAAEDSGESSGGGMPLVFYAAADLVSSFLSPTGSAAELQSGLYRVHFGFRPFDSLNVEVQGGIHEGSYGPGEYRTESYVGAFVVPHTDMLWVFDIAFPVGYANSAAKFGPSAKENLHSVAYGIEASLPLRSMSENLPDLRFTGGGMVYYQKSDARIYGFHFGLSYGFGG